MQLLDIVFGGLGGGATSMQSISQKQQRSHNSTCGQQRSVWLVCLGRLATSSSAAEAHTGLAARADHHSDASLVAARTGTGILQSVLRVQPSRPNIQRPLDVPSPEAFHRLLGQCELFCIRTKRSNWSAVADRMSAGAYYFLLRSGCTLLENDGLQERHPAMILCSRTGLPCHPTAILL